MERILNPFEPTFESFGKVARRNIVNRGTSADRQEALYHARLEEGADPSEALKAVVAAIAEETVGKGQ